MHAERDHLVRFVFPRLREELLQRRIHLVDIDLRWGVTSEQDALEVCREIVDQCRPRFICILGGRYGWIPSGKDRSITADEVYYGVLDRQLSKSGFAYFYFRDPSATAAMVETQPGEFQESAGSENKRKLDELKQAITDHGLKPFTYPAKWDNDGKRLTGLKTFGDRVYMDLKDSIDAEFETQPPKKLDEFAEENAAMEAFVEERIERFVLGSRKTIWEELIRHAEGSGGNGYLCLTGQAGSGKSALLGKFSRDHTNSHPQDLVISHFVGASPGSTDIRLTLRRLCHELIGGTGIVADIPEDPEKLRTVFNDILRQACEKKRVVLIIDAINQFDSEIQSIGSHWLPQELPTNARIILSSIDDLALEQLRHHRNPPSEITLLPLSQSDANSIINEFLKRFRKTITREQRQELVNKEDAKTPLYLLVALEELRTLGTYEEIDQRIEELPPQTQQLFQWILKRLENDDGFRDASGSKIGKELVPRFASLMGASRHGLSQKELIDLLSPDDPQGNVASLLYLLRPYLMYRGELLDFYHSQLKNAFWKCYLSDEARNRQAHQTIASYFETRWHEPNHHALSELPYHQIHARTWSGLRRTLTSIRFMYKKCMAGMTYQLAEDYCLALEVWPSDFEKSLNKKSPLLPRMVAPPDIRLFSQFITAHAHIFTQDPHQVIAFGHNYASSGPVSEAADQEIKAGWYVAPWIELLDRPRLVEYPALHRTLGPHPSPVTRVALSRDSRLAVSGDEKGLICVWDMLTGRMLYKIKSPDGTGIVDLALAGEEMSMIVVTADGTCIRWPSVHNTVFQTLKATQVATCVALTPDGCYAAIGGADGYIHLWNVSRETRLEKLGFHRGAVSTIAIADNATIIASGGVDEEVRIWNTRMCREMARVPGHLFGIRSVAVDSAGTIVFSSEGQIPGDYINRDNIRGMTHRAVIQLISADGKLLMRKEPHNIAIQRSGGGWIGGLQGGTIYSVALTPDGSRGVSVGYDGQICIWNLLQRQFVHSIQSHRGCIRTVALDQKGMFALTGGEDGAVRLWALDGEENVMPQLMFRKLFGHLYWPVRQKYRAVLQGSNSRGLTCTIDEKASLLWRNAHIRNRIIVPVFCLLIFSLEILWLPYSTPVWIKAALAVLFGSWPWSLEWYARALRVKMALWLMRLVGDGRVIGFTLLMILCPFFHVRNCPICGHRICGRWRWFNCESCGFRC